MPGRKKNPRTSNTNNAANINLGPQCASTGAQKNGTPSPMPSPHLQKVVPMAQKAPTIPSIDYKEVQRQEVEVLQSIWMDDYEPVVKTGAWNTTAISFNLTLRPSSTADEDPISCALAVTLTATYPKTFPELKIINPKGLRPIELNKVVAVLKALPQNLLGTEMVHEIATIIQDTLEDIVQLRKTSATMPTFHDQRLKEEELKREKERKREEKRRLEQEKADLEAERVMGVMVEKEMKKRRERALEIQSRRKPIALNKDDKNVSGDQIAFDREITIESRLGGAPLVFHKVRGMVQIARGPMSSVYTVKPILQNNQVEGLPLIMKCVEVQDRFPNSAEGKRQIQSLEIELDKLRTLRHPNITEMYESKVVSITTSEGSGWQVSVLMEYADKHSLRELLETVGTLDVHLARLWTIQLLEGLDFLHSKGIFHKAVHSGNVLVFKSPTGGSTTAKLSDVCYTDLLLKIRDHGKVTAATDSASAFWKPPEFSSQGIKPSAKADVWNLGVIFLQMVFGLDVIKKYDSPETLISSMNLHESLTEFLERTFTADHKKRPRAFDLLPSEFLRNNDPVFAIPSSPAAMRASWSVSAPTGQKMRPRLGSNAGNMGLSRYANDFSEIGRLGKGGFGEVVKARNRLDGRMYAVKKITQTHGNSLTDILSEVMLLSRLNHQYVVRYYTAWLEEDYDSMIQSADEVAVTEEDTTSASKDGTEEVEDYSYHTGTGLDFISSSGYPKIQFGYDSGDETDDEEEDEDEDEEEEEDEDEDEDEDDEDGDGDDESESKPKTASAEKSQKPIKVEPKKSKPEKRGEKGKVTLYIQMELCERQTLRDLLRHDLHLRVDECWRLLRQILEGLVHIHGLGIIHRDLKPDNIFIDVAGNPRIGDLGLATSGQTFHDKNIPQSDNQDSDLTTDVGTALYVAPELRSHGQGKYNEKVDMYSLGIIFFEMCHPLKTAMERDYVIRQLRQREFTLPPEFHTEKKALQGSIIKSLINHRPSERPTSAELLNSGKLPIGVEDETMRLALQTFSDPNNPYHQKLMRILFSQSTKEYKDVAYDAVRNTWTAQDLLLQTQVKEKLIAVFRRHGAVEVSRDTLFPRSRFYAPTTNAVQLLDSTGTLLQLPYDLTLPYARALAREEPPCPRTFTFGTVYREKVGGGQPFHHGEVDFDIVSFDSLDLALKEAEVIKVIDEVVETFPPLRNTPICYHVNHSSLLELIMEFCRIPLLSRPIVKETLSRLNTGVYTFTRIRNELRSLPASTLPHPISATSLDDLSRFDWREDDLEKCFLKFRGIFEVTHPSLVEKAASVFGHIREVVTYVRRFGVERKIYIVPLGTFNDKFYRGGAVMQCVYDAKRREVIAAGGRYDALIQDHRPRMRGIGFMSHNHHHQHSHNLAGGVTETHAVGFSLAWEKLFTSMSKYQRNLTKQTSTSANYPDVVAAWTPKRCDVLVASFDPALLRTEGVELLQKLWKGEIKAELAQDAQNPEKLLQMYRGDGFGWIVIVKAPTVSVGGGSGGTAGAHGHGAVPMGERIVKVKNLFRREDVEVKVSELVVYLKVDMAERERRIMAGTGGSVGEREGGKKLGGVGKRHGRR